MAEAEVSDNIDINRHGKKVKHADRQEYCSAGLKTIGKR